MSKADDRACRDFESHLAQVIQEHIGRYDDAANDLAWSVASDYASQMWADMQAKVMAEEQESSR